jgi:tRNA(fMet)-specific endonuclease VapC
MVVFEIESGLYKSGIGTKRMDSWQWMVSENIFLPVTKEVATLAAMLKANLDRAGTMVSGPDLMIAATAIRHNAPLATRNIREFSRIPDLTIEAW